MSGPDAGPQDSDYSSRMPPLYTIGALAGAGIKYMHEPGLGSRRTPRPDSPNTAWRVEGRLVYSGPQGGLFE